jgi:hypothetical protein
MSWWNPFTWFSQNEVREEVREEEDFLPLFPFEEGSFVITSQGLAMRVEKMNETLRNAEVSVGSFDAYGKWKAKNKYTFGWSSLTPISQERALEILKKPNPRKKVKK